MSGMRGVACLVALGAAWLVAAAAAEPLAVSTRPVALHPEDASVLGVGALRYRGGLDLRSADPRFGGLSALAVDRSGRRLLALTDKGHWVDLVAVYGADGNLAGIGEARIGALGDLVAGSIAGTPFGDAESIAPTRDGFAVGFESRHRIWHYRRNGATGLGRPRVLGPPRGLRRAPSNGGIEALATLADGRLFALTEEHGAGEGYLRAWIGAGRDWRRLRYRRTGRFVPTGAATMANGDVLVLERRFTWIGGLV